MMSTILVVYSTVSEGWKPLHQAHRVISPPDGRDFTQEEILQYLPETEVLCSVFDMPITAELLDRAPKLKLIANYAVGYNNIDIQAAKARGIAVVNTPRSVVIPTAELAFALMIACARRIVELDTWIRSRQKGDHFTRLDMLGWDLYGKTIGIVGYGNIGAALASRCRAFGMKVLYYKRTPLAPKVEAELGLTYRPLDDLLRESDVVSLHTPYSAETHHQIGERELALMKPSSVLINTARGSVVDEDALIRALDRGHLSSAGLDVFEDRDRPRAGLIKHPQVVMTPHVGTQTYDTRVDMVKEVVSNVLNFLSGVGEVSRVI